VTFLASKKKPHSLGSSTMARFGDEEAGAMLSDVPSAA